MVNNNLLHACLLFSSRKGTLLNGKYGKNKNCSLTMLAFGMGGLADEDLFFMAVMPVIWITFYSSDKKHGTFFNVEPKADVLGHPNAKIIGVV